MSNAAQETKSTPARAEAGIGLVSGLGLAGAWMANLGVFVVYQPYFTAAALTVIAIGWLVALRRRASTRTLLVLGCATVLILVAFAVTAYEPQITRYLVALRRK